MNDINEIIVRSKQGREPISFERLKFLCYFVAGMVAEVLGIVVAILFLIRMT